MEVPGLLEADDLDLFDDTSDGTPGAGSDGGDAGAPPAGQDGQDGSKDSKRISDLMSKWQKAEARAKAAEGKLTGSAAPAGAGDGNAPPTVAEMPPEVRAWLETAKDAARERVYNADPRFAKYGIDEALIDGETPDAMRAAAGRVKALIDGIETKARNDALAEFGLTPATAGGGSPKLGDVAAMSDKEFEALVAKAKQAGGLF